MNILGRDNQCSQCSAVAKYTCPRCSIRTCSLPCVQAHKDITDCSGVREKTAYVNVKNFTNLNLLSDYRFLEEASRITSNAARNKDIRRFEMAQNRSLPPWLHRLVVEARLRGTTLRLMPHVFKRRKENSTCYIHKIRKILWHLEWQFPQVPVSYSDKKVPEDTTVGAALAKYIDSKDDFSSIAFYKGCGMNGVKVLIKAENLSSSDPKFFEVDLEDTIKEVLKKKTVIEFPVFLVVIKEHIDSYEVIDEESCLATTDPNATDSVLSKPQPTQNRPSGCRAEEKSVVHPAGMPS